jgi:hypothetical protein
VISGKVYEGTLDAESLAQLSSIVDASQFRSLPSRAMPKTIVEGPSTAPTSVIGQEFHGPTPEQTRLTIQVKRANGLQSINHLVRKGDEATEGTKTLLIWWKELLNSSHAGIRDQVTPNGC